MDPIVIALLLVMLVLAGVELVSSRARSLLAWAVASGAVALLLPWMAAL